MRSGGRDRRDSPRCSAACSPESWGEPVLWLTGLESTRGTGVSREGSAVVRHVHAVVGGRVARILRGAAARRRRRAEAATGRVEAAGDFVGLRLTRRQELPVRGAPTNHGGRVHDDDDEDSAVGSRKTETRVSCRESDETRADAGTSTAISTPTAPSKSTARSPPAGSTRDRVVGRSRPRSAAISSRRFMFARFRRSREFPGALHTVVTDHLLAGEQLRPARDRALGVVEGRAAAHRRGRGRCDAHAAAVEVGGRARAGQLSGRPEGTDTEPT